VRFFFFDWRESRALCPIVFNRRYYLIIYIFLSLWWNWGYHIFIQFFFLESCEVRRLVWRLRQYLWASCCWRSFCSIFELLKLFGSDKWIIPWFCFSWSSIIGLYLLKSIYFWFSLFFIRIFSFLLTIHMSCITNFELLLIGRILLLLSIVWILKCINDNLSCGSKATTLYRMRLLVRNCRNLFVWVGS
jgi:hypothetical protein